MTLVAVRVAIALLLLVGASSELRAQTADTAAVTRISQPVTPAKSNPGPKRFVGSLLGTLVGTVAGGFTGYNALPHDNCGCEDPGLDQMIYGAFVGSAIGAALGASHADLRSVCSFDKRIAKSLAGAFLTGAAAYVVAGGHGNGGTIIAVPFGSVGGSLAGLGSCWRSTSQ